MKYIDFVNYLKSNNINLFDHDYRISYNNINIYYNNYLNNNHQVGGSNNHLETIVNISLSSNPHYLLNLAKN